MQVLERSQALAIAPLWRLGFRPFFLGGALFALLAMAAWVAALNGWLAPQPLGGWLAWHRHEMPFGFGLAIIAGFLVSVLGGSRVQIGGPTGAFIPILYGIVVAYGVNNMLAATFMAGIILLLMGLATALTGLVTRFRLCVVSGMVSALLLAPVCLFIGGIDQCLIFAAVFAVMMVIPGHILDFKCRRLCSEN